MKKFHLHRPESARRQTFIRCLESDYRGPVRAVFERMYLSFSDTGEPWHPPVKLRYMVDDYWELLFNNKQE